MTREQAKEILPIIEAFSKGKTVERLNPATGKWEELKNPSFDLDNSFYRIKREPKCRPFESQEECWNEMLKHQPFGWVKDKRSPVLYHIDCIASDKVLYAFGNHMSFDFIVKNYEFVDGTPFGVKEE